MQNINPKIEFIIMSDGNKISNRQRGQEIANQAWKGVKDSAKWGGKKVVSGVKTTASAVKTVVTTPPKAAWNATKAVGNAIHKTGVGVGRGARDGAYSAIGATEKGLEKIGEAEDKAAKYVDKKVGQNAVAQKLTSGVMAMDEGAYRGKEAIKSGVKKAGSAIGNQYNASLIEGDNLGDNLIDFAAKIPGVKKVVIKTKELADAAGITRAINALNNSKIGKGMIKIGEVQAAGIGTGVRAGKATLRVLGVVKDLFKSGAFKTYSALESAIQKTGLTKLLKASSKELATEDGEGKVKPKKGSISERASNLLGKLKAAGKKFPGVEALLNWFKGVDESDFPVEFEEGGFRFKKDAQYYTNELGDLNFKGTPDTGTMPEAKTSQSYTWDPNQSLPPFTWNSGDNEEPTENDLEQELADKTHEGFEEKFRKQFNETFGQFEDIDLNE